MKKIIALVLCLVMVFALCACGESNTATTAPAADTATEALAEEPAAAGSVYYLNFKPEQKDQWEALAASYTAAALSSAFAALTRILTAFMLPSVICLQRRRGRALCRRCRA